MATFGCAQCFGDDPATAWAALQARRLQSLVQESHFGVHLTECRCGQRFAVVFTERIDWSGGEDDQDWLAVPVTTAEAARLAQATEDQVSRAVTEVAQGRRFLVRIFPRDGTLELWWRESGFAIGPHD